MSDPARCRILLALGDGLALSASGLAAEAGVSPATASSHLRKLTDAGLLAVEIEGRRRNYRLAGPEVAALIEAVERLAPAAPVRSLRQSQQVRSWREARVCYDHVAGRLGVTIMHAMLEQRFLEPVDGAAGTSAAGTSAAGVRYAATADGTAFLQELGVDLPPSRRPVRYHSDSTEEGPHLSGVLGRALLARFVDLGWVRRQKRQRLEITPDGVTGLDKALRVHLDQ